jgi:predicted RNase H-like HicB family nuclease
MDIQQSLTAIFEPAEEGGFIAYIAEIEGANSQGETLEEAKANLLEALEMVLETNTQLA